MIGNVSSRTGAREGESFREELIVSDQNDRSGNSELLRKVAGRGEFCAGGKSSRQDGLAQAQIDLPEERTTFRKWYGQWHKKWTYQTTTGRSMLIISEHFFQIRQTWIQNISCGQCFQER
jgi:hypothetical protein